MLAGWLELSQVWCLQLTALAARLCCSSLAPGGKGTEDTNGMLSLVFFIPPPSCIYSHLTYLLMMMKPDRP